MHYLVNRVLTTDYWIYYRQVGRNEHGIDKRYDYSLENDGRAEFIPRAAVVGHREQRVEIGSRCTPTEHDIRPLTELLPTIRINHK